LNDADAWFKFGCHFFVTSNILDNFDSSCPVRETRALAHGLLLFLRYASCDLIYFELLVVGLVLAAG
jgi:hypothetical protein